MCSVLTLAVPLCACSVEFCRPNGDVSQEFKFSECTPPPHRSTHEVRVVMREAIPRHLAKQLPPGTIHYNANVIDVSASSTGKVVFEFAMRSCVNLLVLRVMG